MDDRDRRDTYDGDAFGKRSLKLTTFAKGIKMSRAPRAAPNAEDLVTSARRTNSRANGKISRWQWRFSRGVFLRHDGIRRSRRSDDNTATAPTMDG
jgi:hypothetical protein